MPNDVKMRAPTTKERLGDLIRSVYDSIAQQPVARISDALGMSDLQGVSGDTGNKQSIMPGPPMARFDPRTAMARPMHPAVPAEFHSVEPNRFAPVDPNQMPSGSMKYMDPDMSPMMESGPEITTLLGDKLRQLLRGR